jgi:nitric oxide reductase subunit B
MSWRWKLSVLFVLIMGFSTLIFMGHETSTQAPPIPDKVVDQSGTTIFTGEDIIAGQGVFQKFGLMDVGSVFGHGAYNGPDFSAEYLHLAAETALEREAQKNSAKRTLNCPPLNKEN